MLHKTGIPIIFLHVGDKTIVDLALRQAGLASPDSDIILLSDEVRALPFEATQALIPEYSKGFKAFQAAYTHVSANPEGYELVCFARWFILREFVQRHGIDRFCIFDSDIMLFSPVEHFAAEFTGYHAGNWAWANVFNGMEALDKMCEHFHNVFSNKTLLNDLAQKYTQHGVPHISDMYLLYELAEQDHTFLDQSDFPSKGYDHNIQSSEGGLYDMNGSIKHLVMKPGGMPIARRSRDGAAIPFHFLHFQGLSKRLMLQVAWPAGNCV